MSNGVKNRGMRTSRTLSQWLRRVRVGQDKRGDSGHREKWKRQNVFYRWNQEDSLMDWVEGWKEREGSRVT